MLAYMYPNARKPRCFTILLPT
nr:hypothetical protein [Bacillus velezensis]